MTYFNISALRDGLETPGLVVGSEALRQIENLRVPVPTKSFLKAEFLENEFDSSNLKWQNGASFPGALGTPFDAVVHSTAEISAEGEVRKPKFEVQLAVRDENRGFVEHFDAGDSFYVICPNSEIDVEFVLARLGLTPRADMQYRLSCVDNAEKPLPPYIPPLCSIRYVLTYCLDIRRVPGRPVIRALAEYCTEPKEKRRMLELCSIEGSKEFNCHIQTASVSVIDLLIHFESCTPPVERLVEILPRLLPRAYTAVSWDLFKEHRRFRFIISLLKTKAGSGVVYSRYGLCSGYLKSLMNGDKVQMIAKEPSKFRFPLSIKPNRSLVDTSVVMIGPGTGVAPFVAFLERFRDLQRRTGENPSNVRRYLFYGSSSLEKEFICRDELTELQKEGILTDLILCESKPPSNGDEKIEGVNGLPSEPPKPKYIYDAVREQPEEFWNFLLSEPQPFIYACGDVKQMSKQLWECLCEQLSQRRGCSKPEALAILKRLRDEEYFIEDVWS